MERYLVQLMEDLQQVICDSKPLNEEQESLDFTQVEKFERNEVTPISEITGIDQEKLPPVEKLSQEQQALLAEKLEELLQCFHFQLDFPVNYPSYLRYAFIRKLWSEKQVAVSSGNVHIEFCYYEKENCPFPGYCHSCKEILINLEYEKMQSRKGNLDDPDYPFDPFGGDDDEPYSEDISDFYDHSVPLPNLCIICKKNQIDDWDENLLCLMTRNDPSNQPTFECGGFVGFEKI